MPKRKRRVYSREFKVSAVERLLAGESAAALSRELRGSERATCTNGASTIELGGWRRCGRRAGRARDLGRSIDLGEAQRVKTL